MDLGLGLLALPRAYVSAVMDEKKGGFCCCFGAGRHESAHPVLQNSPLRKLNVVARMPQSGLAALKGSRRRVRSKPSSATCRYCCKSRKSDIPKILAKVDLWTFLLLRRLSTPLRGSVTDLDEAIWSLTS